MICFTDKDKGLGGSPGTMVKLKKLIDITRRLFLAVYRERGWRSPFVDLELEFCELTDDAPSLEKASKIKLNLDRRLIGQLQTAREIIIRDYGYSEIADGFDRCMDIVLREQANHDRKVE